MQLYRVADENDSGPYCARVSGLLEDHDLSVRAHPTPFEDSALRGIESEEVCACISLPALYEWFSGHSDELTDAGYEVHVLDVPEELVRVGRCGQAVYPRDAAVEIHRFPVSRHAHAYA